MARRRNQRKQKRRLPTRRTARNGRRQKRTGAPSTPQGRTSIGQVIARGVRNLVSYLPGSPLIKPLADFALKTIGLSDGGTVANGRFSGSVRQFALAAKFWIYASNIIAGSRLAVRSGSIDSRNFLTPYCDARVIELTISVMPIGVMGKRAGEWTLSFQPFMSDKDEDNLNASASIFPDDHAMKACFMSVTGSASRPLALTYKPKVSDGRPYFFWAIGTAYGEVSVRYDQYNRTTYTDFNADDFAMDCVISGRVELRTASSSGYSADGGSYIYTDSVKDRLEGAGQAVMLGTKTIVLSSSGYTCKPSSDLTLCNVSGVELVKSVPLTLDDMAITE